MRTLLIVVAIIAAGFIVIAYWSYIFAVDVDGEVVDVQRVTDPTMVVGSNVSANQLYSFAVAIRDDKTGTIHTASTTDRQWAVAKKGFCARAKFFPYPPWKLDKDGTYFSARLEELRDCHNLLKQGQPETATPATPQPSATSSP